MPNVFIGMSMDETSEDIRDFVEYVNGARTWTMSKNWLPNVMKSISSNEQMVDITAKMDEAGKTLALYYEIKFSHSFLRNYFYC